MNPCRGRHRDPSPCDAPFQVCIAASPTGTQSHPLPFEEQSSSLSPLCFLLFTSVRIVPASALCLAFVIVTYLRGGGAGPEQTVADHALSLLSGYRPLLFLDSLAGVTCTKHGCGITQFAD